MSKLFEPHDRIEHVAIIPDGNRRWAKQCGMPKFLGHKYGGENIIEICLALLKYNIKYATFFLFSTENADRDSDELKYLLGILKHLVDYSFEKLNRANCRIRFIGENRIVNGYDLSPMLDRIESRTKNNTGLNVCFCINYGGRQELVQAVKKCLVYSPEEITADLVQSQLLTAGFPEPDILIRTSGEKRLSNFLLWQLAYTELFFVDKKWPEFNTDDLAVIIEEFYKRNRRYGL